MLAPSVSYHGTTMVTMLHPWYNRALSCTETQNDTALGTVMLVSFSEFFNVIKIFFSCVVSWCSDKQKKENTRVCCCCLCWAILTLARHDPAMTVPNHVIRCWMKNHHYHGMIMVLLVECWELTHWRTWCWLCGLDFIQTRTMPLSSIIQTALWASQQCVLWLG